MKAGIYHSCDKLTSAELSEYAAQFLELGGYTEVYASVQGTCHSELAIHCGLTTKKGVVAFVRDISRPYYAYVLFDDGELCGGVFHYFNDGTFSIA